MNCGPVGTLAVHDLAIAGPSGNILRGISFHVPQGAVVCLLGETGTGKSLIAQALLGLLPHGLRAEGTLSLPDGACFDLAIPKSLHTLWGHALFLLPQEPFAALDPTARLLGQVAEAVPSPDHRTRRLTALRRLAGFGLDRAAARKIPAALSGGMAQRGLLAIAAEVAAPVLIVDEPTKGLDALRRGEVAAMLREGGRTLIVITHDLALPAELGADLLVLHDGCVVEHGSAEAVLAAPAHPWTRRLIDAQPARWPRRNASPSGPALISATGIGFAWPGRPTLFRDIDLTLRRGGILGLAGPSGAGKSTLCDVMLGLLPPEQGAISWQGANPAAMPRRRRDAERQRFQKLYQDPVSAFPPHRVLRRVFADLAAVTDDPLGRLPALLERLLVRPDVLNRRVTEISGGEAQRLALTRALLLRPLALIADEPTSRLDAVTQADIALLLREQVEREGMALLLVSHDAALLDAMADEVVRLS